MKKLKRNRNPKSTKRKFITLTLKILSKSFINIKLNWKYNNNKHIYDNTSPNLDSR